MYNNGNYHRNGVACHFLTGKGTMLLGRYNNSIDSKNRVIVPAKLRELLGERCILTIGIENCLCIYSKENFEELAEKMAMIPDSALKARRFVRAVLSNASNCEFDKQGRINVPPHLIKWAKIDKELVTMGMGKRIEIWAKEVWDDEEAASMGTMEEMAESLREFGF